MEKSQARLELVRLVYPSTINSPKPWDETIERVKHLEKFIFEDETKGSVITAPTAPASPQEKTGKQKGGKSAGNPASVLD